MSYVFSLSAFPSFLVFSALGLVFYLVGWLALHILANHAKHDALSIPLGAFIGTIATAWALSLGFVAADIWIVNGKADQAVNDERSAIARLIGSANVNVLSSKDLEDLMLEYLTTVIEVEWGRDKNIAPSHKVDHILQKIRTSIFRIAKEDHPGPIVSQLVHDFDELQDARNARLSVGTTSVDQYKWYLVMSLTLLTLVTIASVHADRKRAGVKALVIYSITSSFCLWILAVHANPYQGAEPLQPEALIVRIDGH